MAEEGVELLNGERAVVFLFVARVFFTVPYPLVLEAATLCLLSLAGILLKIAAENSDATALRRFKTRPGASSGILLGTVTLPTLLLSRLIQTSRALATHDV